MTKVNTLNLLCKTRITNQKYKHAEPIWSGARPKLSRTPKGANLLKYARNFRGLTQAESAAHYGIEERTLRRWENNEYNPRWNDVVALIEDVYMMEVIQVLEGLRTEH
ncbi:helix-turn-helix transcriptional regulator [Pseudoalteromonas phenolica]|uniref:helix-turn-helix transcriptional regulator n=1 Tax=Pseudoalteromonas phenolica TaxID=161398 RepID=UPI00110A2C0F|nr:helix-turn-helix transcriptional regulator [Pseudoalteromonas phenolica]